MATHCQAVSVSAALCQCRCQRHYQIGQEVQADKSMTLICGQRILQKLFRKQGDSGLHRLYNQTGKLLSYTNTL